MAAPAHACAQLLMMMLALALPCAASSSAPPCATAATCRACDADKRCSWCSVKGAVPSCQPKGARSCDAAACGHPAPPPCAKQQFLQDTNIVGSNLFNRHTGPEPAACCGLCRSTRGCIGWTLLPHEAQGTCYLKTAASPTAPMQGAISAAQPNRAPTRFNNTKMGCAFQPQASLPFCDATLPHTARVADLMRRLPVATKLAMLRSKNPPVPSLGLGSYDWDTEVLHGVFSGHENFPTSLLPRPSLFPNGVGLAATFDTELVEEVGGLIGEEQRALNNLVRWTRPGIESGQYQGVNGYAPNCNLYRDPRWGRAQETYGESPVHNGATCAAFIRGLQGNHSEYLRLAATVKHYAFYSGPECDHGCPEFREHGTFVNRGDFNAVVDAQDAAQSYLPMFAAAVMPRSKGGGESASIMSSFSRVNGLSMAANTHFLQKVLREEFQFGEGLVVTDWGSIGSYERGDPLLGTPSCGSNKTCTAARAADCLKAGTDMDLRGGYEVLPQALALGLISESDIDRSLKRSLSLAFRLGRFDSDASVPYRQLGPEVIGSSAHRLVARRAAVASLVLLRNNPPPPTAAAVGGGDRMQQDLLASMPLLPLDLATSGVRGIAVVGPNAVASDACIPYSGDYCICERCETNQTVSILDGLTEAIDVHNTQLDGHQQPVLVKFSVGCTDGLNGTATDGFAAAEALIRSVGISHVVVVVGLSSSLEGEGSDRVPSRFPKGLGLPGMQQELLELAASVGKPLIVVTVAGGATPIPPNPNVTAEIAALYPGMETGHALSDVIFGSVSPAGRLPFSIPKDVTQLAFYLNFSMTAQPFGRTFAWMNGEGSQQLHEYGFGLSFTLFKVAPTLKLSPTSGLQSTASTLATDSAPNLTLSASVTNIGNRTSDEVLQCYSTWKLAAGDADSSRSSSSSSMRVPVRQLVAFVRLAAIKPGETRSHTFAIKPQQYALVAASGERVLPKGEMTLSVGGHQPTDYSTHASGGAECVSVAVLIH